MADNGHDSWTLVTLHAHWEALRLADKEAVKTALDAAEKAVAAAMAASEKAILKAETASDKRAEAANEIRAAMVDQQRNFADKESTERRLKLLEEADIASRGKAAGGLQLWQVLFAIIIAVGAVFGMVALFTGGTP